MSGERKCLALPEFKLTDGRLITILKFGIYNEQLKGPDFLYGALSVDQLKLHGNIEIHIKSSDWYKHKHHHDPHYDNVILHVVYEHDREVYINGKQVMTLELKELMSSMNHQRNLTLLKREDSAFLCRNNQAKIPSIYWDSMLQKTVYSKLYRKVELIKEEAGAQCPEEFLYHAMAAAFGTNLNQKPFLALSRKVVLNKLKTVSVNQRGKVVVIRKWINI